MPLERLENRQLLDSFLADPTQKRGGRSKRIYRLTKKGMKALSEIRLIEEEAWKDLPRPSEEIT
jgi:DNA-binding PadR family transcriptional regulator